jgi:hypothetical protein
MLIVYANALFGRWKNAVYAAITVKIPGSIATDLISLFFWAPTDERGGEKLQCQVTEHPI